MLAKRKKPSKMQEYVCTGTLELNGVTFFIEASSPEEAAEKARLGEWRDWEIGGAESVNWELDPRTVEDNN